MLLWPIERVPYVYSTCTAEDRNDTDHAPMCSVYIALELITKIKEKIIRLVPFGLVVDL